MADLLRHQGRALSIGGIGCSAEDCCLQALEWARRQQALSWELRAATSLARLAHQLGRDAEAAELLFSVYDRFSEGFVTG